VSVAARTLEVQRLGVVYAAAAVADSFQAPSMKEPPSFVESCLHDEWH
jgi:hypothetical protein